MSEDTRPFFRRLGDAIISRLYHGPLDLGLNASRLTIDRLDLKPGDRLVVKVNEHLSAEAVKKLLIVLEPKLPFGVDAIVIDKSTDLAVLSAPESKSIRSAA